MEDLGCINCDSKKIVEALNKSIKENNISNVKVIQVGCFGICAKATVVVIRPEDTFYAVVKVEDVEDIINIHIKEGKVVERLLCKDIDGTVINKLEQMGFYKKQKRIALQNCGRINPDSIDEYIAFDGYSALEKVLFNMSQDDVVNVIKDSGLKGRGGAGFSTGMKWEFTKKATGDQKYVVCNADEGDPGAFMDRSVLEGDPHSVIEAMEIAGYAIGADKGYIYVRAEYPIAVKRLGAAIEQAKKYGILGKNIFRK